MSASGNPMSGLLAGIWQRGLPQLMERLALLDRAAAAEPLAAELRLEATAVAHKLAGSLGMFGFREGTEFARELEVELERETVSRARVAELVKALRESLFPAE